MIQEVSFAKRRSRIRGALQMVQWTKPLSCSSAFCLAFSISMMLSTLAEARPIHYGAADSADINQCDRLHWTGQLPEAKSCYEGLLSNQYALHIQAEAVWALGDVQQANNLFQAAVRSFNSSGQTPENISNKSRTMSRWADLYVETYQLQDALDLYVEAGELDPKNEYAALGAAKVLLTSGDANAGAYLGSLIEEADNNSGAKLQAFLTQAAALIRAGKANDAEEALAEAEKIALRADFPLLEIYALRAGIDIRRNTDPMGWVNKALAINPHYGDAYAIPAFFYVITFKYDQAGEFYQNAVDTDPTHYSAHLELAANHLRQNRSSLAREHFTIAFEGDPYNPEAVNSMRLMDTYDSLDVVNFPQLDITDQTENETAKPRLGIPDLSLRLDKAERDILTPYVSELALDAIEVFEKRYRFTLKETAHIELYPNHDDFIVRALGMPGTPLLGVAFGYLVAMDSPSAKAGGDYHWGTTLWHEVAHIFTIKASKHNTPRWFSEGVSVFEEWQTGPLAISESDASEQPGLTAASVRIPMHVYSSLLENEFLSIDDLDNGFSRPTYENQVLVSYHQAGLICDFVTREYGFDALVDMLEGYGNGLITSEIIQSVLGLTTDQFDRRFQAYFDQYHSGTLANLSQWQRHVQDAASALQKEDWEEAIRMADLAIGLMPDYSDPDSPYLLKAEAYEELGQQDKKLDTLNTFWLAGGYNPKALKDLANGYYDQGKKQRALDVFQSINLVDPFDIDVHLSLGDLFLESSNPDQALIEFKVALALDPLDRATVLHRIGVAYQQLGEAEKARTQALAALDIAPHFRPAQALLMETLNTK